MVVQSKAVGRQAKANEDTLVEIKAAGVQTDKLVEHAGKQAEAALLYAKSIINTERAWFLVYDLVPGWDNDDAPTSLPRYFTYRVRNYGKTPGKLLGVKAELQVGDDPDIPPSENIFEVKGAVATDLMLTPEGGQSLTRESERYEFADEDRQNILESGAYLWACGSLHYRDVFGQIRVTPFCYRLHAYTGALHMDESIHMEFVLAGLPGYNTPT